MEEIANGMDTSDSTATSPTTTGGIKYVQVKGKGVEVEYVTPPLPVKFTTDERAEYIVCQKQQGGVVAVLKDGDLVDRYPALVLVEVQQQPPQLQWKEMDELSVTQFIARDVGGNTYTRLALRADGATPAVASLPLPYVQNGHLNPTHLAGDPIRLSSAVYTAPIRGTVGQISPGSLEVRVAGSPTFTRLEGTFVNGGHGRLAQLRTGDGVLTHCVTVPAGYYMNSAFFVPDSSVFRPQGMRVLRRATTRPVWVDPLPPPPHRHFIARGHYNAPRRGGGYNGRGGGHFNNHNPSRGGVNKRGFPARGSFGRAGRGQYGCF